MTTFEEQYQLIKGYEYEVLGIDENEFYLEPIDEEPIVERRTRKGRVEKYSSPVQRTIKRMDREFYIFRKTLRKMMTRDIGRLSPSERKDVLRVLREFYPYEIRKMWKDGMKEERLNGMEEIQEITND